MPDLSCGSKNIQKDGRVMMFMVKLKTGSFFPIGRMATCMSGEEKFF
jgi:hypothetical protein